MRSIPARVVLLLVTLVPFAVPANADWPPGGLLVSSQQANFLLRNVRILPLPSGNLAVVGVRTDATSFVFDLQHIQPEGAIASGWPATGVFFGSTLTGILPREHSFVSDDQSRVWHTWAGSNALVQSIAADATSWPGPGMSFSLGSSGGGPARATAAPGGQLYVMCGSARLKRITSTGAAAPGWATTGVTLPGSAFDDNAILGDGNGGVVVFMRASFSGGVPIATRIDGDGARHAGWPAGGLILSPVSVGPNIARDSKLLPSGPDHFLAVWTLPAPPAGTSILRMQRFGLDATLDPAWPTDGLNIVVSDTLQTWSALADGSGGAYVIRHDNWRPVGTHVTAAAEFLGGSDVDLLDAAAEYVPAAGQGPSPEPTELIADSTPDGGLLVGWNDTRLAPAVSYRLRWLTPTLTPAPGKPDTGLVFFPGSPNAYVGSMLALRTDGPDAALVAWGDYTVCGPGCRIADLWMTRVQAPTLVSVEPTAPRAPVLALSAPHPNPARGAVAFEATLPDDAPARIVLLDVAGRVQRTRIVRGAGARRVEFAGLGALPPGLYFAHLSHPRGSATSRVVVSR